MSRFVVYQNPDGGYLLDVQADLLSHLNTRIVVPLLVLEKAPQPAGTLNPLFQIRDDHCVMVTQFMAAVPASLLKNEVVSLEGYRADIIAAIDLLMQGF